MRRNDFVVFKSGFNQLPVIKKVVAVPGDVFSIGDLPGGQFCLLINGDTSRTAMGNPMSISAARMQTLKYFRDTYAGVLPVGTCLVLGSLPGTHDSTLFGPLGFRDILGKAEPVKSPAPEKRKCFLFRKKKQHR